MTLAASPKTTPHRYKTVTDGAGHEHKVCSRCNVWEGRAPNSCAAADAKGLVSKTAARKVAKKPAPRVR